MKTPLLILMLALISTSTMAAWAAVNGGDQATQYADFVVAHKTSSRVNMWELRDHKTMDEVAEGKYLSVKLQQEYGGKEEQLRRPDFSSSSEDRGESLWEMACISASMMAEWTVVGVNAVVGVNDDFTATTYADFTTICKAGDKLKMRVLFDFKSVREITGHEYLSAQLQYEFDCKEEQYRLLAFSSFSGNMGNGQVVYSNGNPDKWLPLTPGSVGRAIWKIACSK